MPRAVQQRDQLAKSEQAQDICIAGPVRQGRQQVEVNDWKDHKESVLSNEMEPV